MRRSVLGVAAGLMLVSAAGACSLMSPLRPSLGITNGTTLDVALFVNGTQIVVSKPGGPAPVIDSAGLPPLPWTVEARSESGRLLTSMRVEEGQVSTTTRPDGGVSTSGVFGRVDLSCGRLTIWAGDTQPSGPAPPASPGEPGDCLP